jgi:hypothetical protein
MELFLHFHYNSAAQSKPTHSFWVKKDRKNSCVRSFSNMYIETQVYALTPLFCVLLHADELLSIIYCKMSSEIKCEGRWVGKSYNYSHKKKENSCWVSYFFCQHVQFIRYLQLKTRKIADS